MVLKADQQRIKALLKDTITLLCKNGLSFRKEFCVEALIGVTLDQDDVLLVSINETIVTDLQPSGKEAEGDISENTTRSMGEDHHVSFSPNRVVHKSASKRGMFPIDPKGDGHRAKRQRTHADGGGGSRLGELSLTSGTVTIVKQEIPEAWPLCMEDDGQEKDFKMSIPALEEPLTFEAAGSFASYGPPVSMPSTPATESDWSDPSSTPLKLPTFPDMSAPQTSSIQSRDVKQPLTQDSVTISSQQPNFPQGDSISPQQSIMLKDVVLKSLARRHAATQRRLKGSPSSKLHRCTFCGKYLVTRNALVTHENHHRGIYRFYCSLCAKGFYSQGDLKGHMSSRHTAVREFKCTLCSKTYAYKQHLAAHMKSSHGSALPPESSVVDIPTVDIGRPAGHQAGRIAGNNARGHVTNPAANQGARMASVSDQVDSQSPDDASGEGGSQVPEEASE